MFHSQTSKIQIQSLKLPFTSQSSSPPQRQGLQAKIKVYQSNAKNVNILKFETKEPFRRVLNAKHTCQSNIHSYPTIQEPFHSYANCVPHLNFWVSQSIERSPNQIPENRRHLKRMNS